MKYWSKRRIQRVKERRARVSERSLARHLEAELAEQTYTKGDARRNARLMLDALGSSLHRRMLARLRKGGAMSVSRLVEPFRLRLSNAMRHVALLERAGLVVTKKQGRIRFCIFNPRAQKELAAWLTTREALAVD